MKPFQFERPASFMGNERMRHTIQFLDVPRVRGKFASPTRTWQALRDGGPSRG